MRIQQDVDGNRVNLIKTGHTTVVDLDDWTVTVEVAGLNDAGERAIYRIMITKTELAIMMSAAL